jgi:ribonuclease P protein component
LQKKIRYTLGKDERLKSRKVIEQLFKEGKSLDRNRIRRLMKEAYRLQKHALQNSLEQTNKQVAVFFIYVAKEIPEYPLVVEKIASVLERLQKIINENNSTNT